MCFPGKSAFMGLAMEMRLVKEKLEAQREVTSTSICSNLMFYEWLNFQTVYFNKSCVIFLNSGDNDYH